MTQVVLYSRPGCHLCARALVALRALRASPGDGLLFELTEVNIEADPELERRFLLEIPVIEVDGAVVTRAPVEIAAVRAAHAVLPGPGGAGASRRPSRTARCLRWTSAVTRRNTATRAGAPWWGAPA